MAINFSDLGGGGAAKIQRTVIIKSTQSWTTPSDVTEIDLILCGGGGGGGKATIAAGGGSGSYFFDTLTVAPSTGYTVTIGAGGAGATVDWNTGSDGSASSFGALLTATGGAGGRVYANGPVPANAGFGAIGAMATYNQGGMNTLNGSTASVLGGSGGTGASPGYSISNTVGNAGGGSGAWNTTIDASSGIPNSGAGGGGGNATYTGRAGGSGVAIIKYWSAV